MPKKKSSNLKRRRVNAEDAEQSEKKPRRSERISSQLAQPREGVETLDPSAAAATPSDIDSGEKGTVSPPEGIPSQRRLLSPAPETFSQRSSPPTDTQTLSQTISRHITSRAEFEVAEGVWGYLMPLDHRYGDTPLILRKRDSPGTSRPKRGKDKEKSDPRKSHPSGYLIGRHSECDFILDIATISNRHCIIFQEITNGASVAILEDLSSNGTFVNEAIVGRNQHRQLEDGDEITILDEARFVFRYPRARSVAQFEQQYRILKLLGEGFFANVYACAEKSTGIQFAVKKFKMTPVSDHGNLQREVAVLKGLNHENLTSLKDIFCEPTGTYLVLELAPVGDLYTWISEGGCLSEDQTRHVIFQLLLGLKYLHERNIIHRDIKPENILVFDQNLNVKLADFGLAKIVGETSFTTSLCGTPGYAAPEVLFRNQYSHNVDIWSLGVVLYICLCAFPPFSDEYKTREFPHDAKQQIKKGLFTFPSPYWDRVSNRALNLIDRMLDIDAERRATIDDCIQHPWLGKKPATLTDSTDGIVGALDQLDFSKRRLNRQRTLLSDLAKPRPEQKPDANRGINEFMRMGGHGDQVLFPQDSDCLDENDEAHIK